ncbi:MAG: helix-turn-helix domain-containing protein [Paraburkholderia sp.]|jgi:AcrR family transcriptional regulator|uniref:TetR/AcrR family transcriptional regulator n=1 Tax=Burkholderiaceae TaxID=119060 RepID=UPI001485AE5E|nr:helix-turn-helix domain-containing protein [Burkholderia sp. 4M9327F10]
MSGEARKNHFLDMAAEIVIESGVANVTMDAVAARSSVDKRLGYRYFSNRDDLLEALVHRELERMAQRVEAALPSGAPFAEKLAVNTRIWLSMLTAQGPLLRRLLYDQGPLETYSGAIRQAAVTNWAATLVAETGLPERDATTVTRMLLAALMGAIEALEAGDSSLDTIVELYVATVVAIIRTAIDRVSVG